MAKILIIIGLILTGAGLVLWRFPNAMNGVGKLPGDLHYQGEQSSIHFPIATCLVVSVLLSFLFWLVRR